MNVHRSLDTFLGSVGPLLLLLVLYVHRIRAFLLRVSYIDECPLNIWRHFVIKFVNFTHINAHQHGVRIQIEALEIGAVCREIRRIV